MTVRDLETLYDYSYWANAKLLEPLSRPTREELVRPVAGVYGSIRTTLVHMMSAEGGCLDRRAFLAASARRICRGASNSTHLD